MVRHTDSIHLGTLKNQLKNFPDVVFTETQLRISSDKLPAGDIIDIDISTAQDACDRGDLFLLPVSRLPAPLDLSTVRDDYLPNSLMPCAVGHTISSSVIISNTSFSAPRPTILADFFDIDAFPGRRALQKTPRGIAERALLAHGVSADEVYSALDNPRRAWPIIENALDSLRGQITWIENDHMAIRAIDKGRASFAVISSQAGIRYALSHGDARWNIVWDQALYQIHTWAIPSSSQNQAAAWSLIQHLAHPQVNGRYSTAAGNGPARISALSLVNAAYQPHLPGYADNAANLVLQNDQWWVKNGARYQERFNDWLARTQARRTSAEPARPSDPLAQWPRPAALQLLLSSRHH